LAILRASKLEVVTFLQKNNPLTTPANPLADSARLIVFGKRLSRTQKNPIPVEVEYLPSNPSGNRLEGGSQSFLHWTWRTALSIVLFALFRQAFISRATVFGLFEGNNQCR
jgi:hypothetical protein